MNHWKPIADTCSLSPVGTCCYSDPTKLHSATPKSTRNFYNVTTIMITFLLDNEPTLEQQNKESPRHDLEAETKIDDHARALA
jgi:hypothetical protein